MSIVQYPENEHVHSRRKVQPTKKMSIDIEDAYGVIRRITPYASSMSIVLIPRMHPRLRRPCYSMALFTLRCIASCMQDAMHRSVNGVLQEHISTVQPLDAMPQMPSIVSFISENCTGLKYSIMAHILFIQF